MSNPQKVTAPCHIIAVAGFIENDAGDLLMIQDKNRGWEFPAGKVELEEDLLSGLRREIIEESGCSVTDLRLFAIYSRIGIPSLLLHCFRAKPLSRVAPSQSAEWISPALARKQITHPAISGALEDYLSANTHVFFRSYKPDPFEFIAVELI